MKSFSLDDAADIFGIDQWGLDYFRIGEAGEVEVFPHGENGPKVALPEVIKSLRKTHGVPSPMLIRFPQILQDRLKKMHQAFANSIEEYAYSGTYKAVYPVKVNQNKAVVETLVTAGKAYGYGLEAGSKAELAVCLGMHKDPEALICCNGFKDQGFLHLALLARKLGRKVVITLEKPSELAMVIQLAREMDVEPILGIRFRLFSRGSGLWEKSGGDLSKFGLNAAEMLTAIDTLREAGCLHWLEMLHCHIGSQVTDIRRIKKAIKEASRVYVEVVKLGAAIRYLNVGGGLGVDYDGSRTTFHSSINYTLQEYANDVVWTIQENCKKKNVSVPCIVTESGRAVTAYHAVLVLPVLEVVGPLREQAPVKKIEAEAPSVIRELDYVFEQVSRKNFREMFHDALAQREEMHTLFSLGYINLEQRASGEALFYKICAKVLKITREVRFVPDDLENLEDLLADRYICNFSLFQSLPDFWAVGTLFPIMPLQRLCEEPLRRATLADITCDSDGKVDKFIGLKDIRHSLPLHQINPGESYDLGAFLVGAYQEVLGDQHNLFGRLAEAQVELLENGDFQASQIRSGQTVMDVATHLGYNHQQLIDSFVEIVAKSSLNADHKKKAKTEYFQALGGYTYLDPGN